MVEVLSAPNHRERILMALSKVPIATTEQLATLNDRLDPSKRASEFLRRMEGDGLVSWRYHGREKVWRLTPKGWKAAGASPMKWTTRNIDHALSIGALYFAWRPKRFLFEPRERFTYAGRDMCWAPDCITVYKKRLYVIEVQKTRLPRKRWERKWGVFNIYFNRRYYERAAFQKWAKEGTILMPQFVVLTDQDPELVKSGFEVNGSDLIVLREM